MKKQIATITAAILFVGMLSTTAWAGPARRHTLEGFALGAGAVLLGTAIIQGMSKPAPVVAHRTHRHSHHDKGYWKTERVWVPGAAETRWNPGHYDPDGRWVEGRYQEFVVSDGHWESRQVWVSNRCRY